MSGQGPARVVQVNVSRGGVPKLPVPEALITREGVAGDRQLDRRYHGGPERAVSVWSLEVIESLRAEGHPVVPGGAGENLTVTGLDWSAVRPGVRLRLAGGVELAVTAYAAPCNTIRANFRDGDFERISDQRHPGSSRVYCRVLREGRAAVGEGIVLLRSDGGTETSAPSGACAPPPGC